VREKLSAISYQPSAIRRRVPEAHVLEFPELEAHYRLLEKWNRTLNLTRIEDVERNYGESLFLGRHLPAGRLRICDIGSGAGFPGFPVAIFRKDCEVTLIEAHQRKAVFLKEASRGIPNIRVVAKRAEDVAEKYDWAVSRAVSDVDLSAVLPRLAGQVALLTGAEEPQLDGFTWNEPVLLPASRNRYLRIGYCFT
jgi:16S rRNA (guanine527-N7)-methyltransferase